ncbi:MAG: lipoate--protein ligase family protein [Anaerolineae bacterium]
MMKLYSLGHVPWLESQLIYHALPRLGMEGLVLVVPVEPYVCIGYHQDVTLEVDLDYCHAHCIPVFRREVGGGAVYLDGNQLFYQVVLHKDNPLALSHKGAFYRTLLEPVAETYRQMGIAVWYKPVNDIVTAEGRKISGTGAAEIGDYLILVGNIIMDFDYETMVRVLRVPDEKYRGKVHKSLRENLSTIRRELGAVPPLEELEAALVANYEVVLGPLERAKLPPAVYDKVAELRQTFTTDEWLYKRGKRREDWRVKIVTGVEFAQRMYKAPGGLIRAIVEIRDGLIAEVSLSGDFFFYPADKLEALEVALTGVDLSAVEPTITEFYRREGIESPGVIPSDFAKALTGQGGRT